MEWTQLILDFVAELKWPIVVLFIFFKLRQQWSGLIERVTSFEFPGGVKGTLAEPLEHLNEEAETLQADVAEIGQIIKPQGVAQNAMPNETFGTQGEAESSMNAPSTLATGMDDRLYEVERQVLETAESSPELALIRLTIEIERELRDVLASRGRFIGSSAKPVSGRLTVRDLARERMVPKSVESSVDAFWDVRNRIVHGREATAQEVIQAIDSGLTILRSLKAIPREYYTIYEPEVDLFTDADGKDRLREAWGVIVETQSPGGVIRSLRVFPTTQRYEKGKRVSWEWKDKIYPECWYLNPDSGSIEYAWRSSGEFAGRHLEDLP